MSLLSAALAVSILPVVSGQADPAIGTPCPPLSLAHVLQGPEVPTSLQALQGKVVVLEFWATWCAPCIAAMPHINDLASQFADKPVQFIAVSHESPSKIEDFVKRGRIKTAVGVDDGSLSSAFNIQWLPRTVILDAQGRIAELTTPTELTAATIERVLDGKPAAERGSTAAAAPASATEVPVLYELSLTQVQAPDGGGVFDPERGVAQVTGFSTAQLFAFVMEVSPSRLAFDAQPVEGYFDLRATMRKGHESELRTAMQDLLEASFGVRCVRERRSVPAFVLTAPRGPGELLETPTDLTFHASFAAGTSAAQNASLESLVSCAERQLGVPVVDETGLTAKYDWSIVYRDKDEASFLQALAGLGIAASRQPREVELVVVEPR